MEMKIKLRPIQTPNYVLAEARPGLRQDGMVECQKWHIGEIDEETLSELCDQFRRDIFKKAGKRDFKDRKEVEG